METIKDLYKRLLDHHPAPLFRGAGGVHRTQIRKRKKKRKSISYSFLSLSNLSHKQLGVAGAAERAQQQSMQNSKVLHEQSSVDIAQLFLCNNRFHKSAQPRSQATEKRLSTRTEQRIVPTACTQ
jgi:hypothetical protein